MSKILQILLHAVFGAVISGVVWSIIVSIIVSLEIYRKGGISFDLGMGGGGIEPEVPIIIGMIFGIVQGFLIGLIIGIFDIDTIIKGGLAGFTATEIILLLYYIVETLSLIFAAKNLSQALDAIEISNFIVLSIVLFIPSILSGVAATKILTLTRPLLSFGN